MINKEICSLREELNDSIVNGEDYREIYRISIELDELIAKYYKVNVQTSNRRNENSKEVVVI